MISHQETGTARLPFQDLIDKRGRLSSRAQEVISSAQQEYDNLLTTFEIPSLQEGFRISTFAASYLENRLIWRLAKGILSASPSLTPQTRTLENSAEEEIDSYFAARGNVIADHAGLYTLTPEQNKQLRTPLEELENILHTGYILIHGLEKENNILHISAFESARDRYNPHIAGYILAEKELLSPEKMNLNGLTIPDILPTPLSSTQVKVPGLSLRKKALLSATAAMLAATMARDTFHQPTPTITSNPGIEAGTVDMNSPKEPKSQPLTTEYIEIAKLWISGVMHPDEPSFQDWMNEQGYDVSMPSYFGPTPRSHKAGSIGWIVRRHPTDDPEAPQREVSPRVNRGHRVNWISEVQTTNRKTGLTQNFGLLWPPEIVEIPKTQMSQAEIANALKLNAVEMNDNIVYVYPRYVLLAERPENGEWRWFIEPEDNMPSDAYKVWDDGSIEFEDGLVGPSLLDRQRANGK